MTEFKKGDSVVLRKDSEYYNTNFYNPDDTIKGVVEEIDPREFVTHNTNVTWSNTANNDYRPTDLQLATPEKEEIIQLTGFSEEQSQALIKYIDKQIEKKLKQYE